MLEKKFISKFPIFINTMKLLLFLVVSIAAQGCPGFDADDLLQSGTCFLTKECMSSSMTVPLPAISQPWSKYPSSSRSPPMVCKSPSVLHQLCSHLSHSAIPPRQWTWVPCERDKESLLRHSKTHFGSRWTRALDFDAGFLLGFVKGRLQPRLCSNW